MSKASTKTKTESNVASYQATRSFVTYVAGDVVSLSGGQMVAMTEGQAADLLAAGYLVPEAEAATPVPTGLSRIISDVVPDPDDITEAEKRGTSDVRSGRDYVDPSIRAARAAAEDGVTKQADSAGETHGDVNEASDAEQNPVEHDPEGTHTNPKDDGTAAKGSATTGKQDISKGPKPASKPVKTGQTTAKRPPKATGRGKVGGKDPDIEAEDVSTVGANEPTVEPTGPNRDEPEAQHPSPGTTALPDSP
jgi:hypothetical protein